MYLSLFQQTRRVQLIAGFNCIVHSLYSITMYIFRNFVTTELASLQDEQSAQDIGCAGYRLVEKWTCQERTIAASPRTSLRGRSPHPVPKEPHQKEKKKQKGRKHKTKP